MTEKRLSVGLNLAPLSTRITAGLLLGLSVCLMTGPSWAKPLALDVEQDPQVRQQPMTPSAPVVAQANQKTDTHGKKPHPVVIAPEPLLPTASSSVRVASQPFNSAQAAAVSTEIESDPARFNNKSAADKDFKDEPTQVMPTAPAMASANDEMGMRPPAQEPGMYPVGFTPAVRSVTTLQGHSLETALSHYNRGVYYSQRKAWDQAVAEYSQAITLNITLADAYVGLSTAALHKRDWENALRNGHQALRLKDNFLEPANITQARYNLSTVYCVADDYHRAARYYEQVKQSGHPETGDLWAFLQTNCHP